MEGLLSKDVFDVFPITQISLPHPSWHWVTSLSLSLSHSGSGPDSYSPAPFKTLCRHLCPLTKLFLAAGIPVALAILVTVPCFTGPATLLFGKQVESTQRIGRVIGAASRRASFAIHQRLHSIGVVDAPRIPGSDTKFEFEGKQVQVVDEPEPLASPNTIETTQESPKVVEEEDLYHGSNYRQYASREEEDQYWERATRARRQLAFSSAHYSPNAGSSSLDDTEFESASSSGRPILYYVPKLLPEYRQKRTRPELESLDYSIPAASFARWHNLVFPDRMHPSLNQVEEIVKGISHRDLQQIQRMAREVKDHDPFWELTGDEEDPMALFKYTLEWEGWLESKGPDLAIVFENEDDEELEQ